MRARFSGVRIERASFQRLCRARELLSQMMSDPLSVHEVARATGLSSFHFIRQFYAVFGMTPHQFRIRVRLERAKQLLATGELSVTEVCMAVGFSSLGSFSQSFAGRVGLPPSAYRRRASVVVPDRLTVAGLGCFGLMTRLPRSAFRNSGEA